MEIIIQEDKMESIVDLFFLNVEKYPKKTAVWCGGKEVSYRGLAEKVCSYENFFLEIGIKKGENIGLPMNNSIESVAVMLAAAELGCAIVPINPTLPKGAVESAFAVGKVKHLVARKSFYQRCEKWDLMAGYFNRICMDGIYPGTLCLQNIKAEDYGGKRCQNIQKTGKELFIITTTSGSTGSPKAIAISQEDKLKRIHKHIDLYHLGEEDRILASTPLYHSLAERLVLLPLCMGATSILLPRFTPNLWIQCIEKQKVTFTIAVSAQLGQVAELLSSPFLPKVDSLKCVVSSSAPLEPHIRTNLINRLSCEFHEMYGTSEISTATDIDFKEMPEKQKSVGKALKGVDIAIRKEDGGLCRVGEIGEITCKTELLCSGYYGMPDAFEESCLEGFFKTGDLGYMDGDGYLYYTGRIKEIIITGGINVYPIDVENCVARLDSVKECAAFSYPDERLGEVVAVAVVEKESKKINVHDIQVQCAQNLADFQQPHKIFVVDELPRNAMGKLVKGKILEYIKRGIE